LALEYKDLNNCDKVRTGAAPAAEGLDRQAYYHHFCSMDKSAIKGLHPLEIRLLLHFDKDEPISADRVMAELSYNLGQCNQAFSWLTGKQFLEEKQREKRIQYALTDLGQNYREHGTPEERIVALVEAKGGQTLPALAEVLGLEQKEVGSAFGSLAKSGLLSLDVEKKVHIKDTARREGLKSVQTLLALFDERETIAQSDLESDQVSLIGGLSRKRGAAKGLFRIMEREEVQYRLTPEGVKTRRLLEQEGISGDEIGVITPDLISSGGWKTGSFRAYNINTPPSRVLLGRKNPYVEFLERLKDKLISIGFEEFEGPLLETEFWNGDALFMPQFHSARDIHDVYYVKEPTHAKEIEQPYLDQVAATHENGWKTGSLGWQYSFDRDFTRRLILRSHGTVLSAKSLTRAKVPGKYFGVVRCFRYDRVDATHLADFYQTEGIVLGEEVNLKTLLGLLKMFAVDMAGAEDLRFVPGYFPFTEPSVEIHIKHPELGWFELGGSGIFRPEVTEPLGISVPVLAWGLGIDRMALVALGLNDLRDLFTNDIEQVRLRRKK